MPPLRQHMIAALPRRGKRERTQQSYSREVYACWRRARAHPHPSSPHPSASITCGIAKTSLTSRPPPCASALVASASSPSTCWNALGSAATSCELQQHTGSHLSSVGKTCVACSAWPPLAQPCVLSHRLSLGTPTARRTLAPRCCHRRPTPHGPRASGPGGQGPRRPPPASSVSPLMTRLDNPPPSHRAFSRHWTCSQAHDTRHRPPASPQRPRRLPPQPNNALAS
jgi:hypothetical protein